MMSETEALAGKASGVEYSPTRANRRYVPLEPISVVLLMDDSYISHGVASNISTSGACLIMNTEVEPDGHVRVRFSRNHQEELFQAKARVVWAGEGMDPHLEIVGVMVGIQFLDVEPALEEKIVAALEKGRFHEVGMPSATEGPDALPPPSTGT
jgi:hypothetical protein